MMRLNKLADGFARRTEEDWRKAASEGLGNRPFESLTGRSDDGIAIGPIYPAAKERAPIAGRAGQQQVTEGALVGEGAATLLTTVDQIDPLYVEFSLGVDELSKLREMADGTTSREVQVVLADGTVYDHAGTLDFASDAVDPATGAVALRARLPNPEHRLLPGAFVTVRATLSRQQASYLVPQVAVQRDAQGAYVLVLGADGKVARKGITTSLMQGSNWIVNDGLAPGDKVITSGLQRVQPGQPAKEAPAQPAAGAAAAPAKQG